MEQKPTTETKPCNHVGNVGNATALMSWNFTDGLAIESKAFKVGERCWRVETRARGELRAVATVFGGKGLAKVVCKHLRNALTARVKRLKKIHANYRANKATAALAAPGRVSQSATGGAAIFVQAGTEILSDADFKRVVARMFALNQESEEK